LDNAADSDRSEFDAKERLSLKVGSFIHIVIVSWWTTISSTNSGYFLLKIFTYSDKLQLSAFVLAVNLHARNVNLTVMNNY